MNYSKKSLISFCFLTLSLFVFNDVRAQTKKAVERISTGVINGRAVSLPKPEYPDAAQKAGITGKVNVQVEIDESGKVVSAKAVSGIEDASIRKAAETAALQAKFAPTLLSGKPVKVSGVIVYDFVIEKSNEEKVQIFGISTFLRMLGGSAANLAEFNKFFGSSDMIKETIEEFPAFSSDLSPLSRLENLPPESRVRKIDEVTASIKTKLNGSDLWQFELGGYFGGIISQFMAAKGENGFDPSKLDETELKQNLLKIKELCATAPPDFPKDVLSKLVELAEMADKDKIVSAENYDEFSEKMMALLETISPD
jgi:TonB family protein